MSFPLPLGERVAQTCQLAGWSKPGEGYASHRLARSSAPPTLIQGRLIAFGDKAPYPSPIEGEGAYGFDWLTFT